MTIILQNLIGYTFIHEGTLSYSFGDTR